MITTLDESPETRDCASLAGPVDVTTGREEEHGSFFPDRDGDGVIDAAGDICAHLGLGDLSNFEQEQIQARLGAFAAFQPRSPAGFYKLHLSNEMERLVALRLLAISNADGAARRAHLPHPLADLSQRGNYSCFRDEMYALGGKMTPYMAIEPGWRVPEVAVLSCEPPYPSLSLTLTLTLALSPSRAGGHPLLRLLAQPAAGGRLLGDEQHALPHSLQRGACHGTGLLTAHLLAYLLADLLACGVSTNHPPATSVVVFGVRQC
jgi:hypothetical protein